MSRFAVIPTTGRAVLNDCLDAISPQVDQVVLVAHNCQPDVVDHPALVHYTEKIPNISVMWNLGLDRVQELAQEHHYVAVLNDDAVVPPRWFDAVVDGMTAHAASAGSSGWGKPWTQVHREPGPVPLEERMSGFAFILNSGDNLRLDEQFQWWYGDDDLEWRAREASGVVKVQGHHVDHRYPNGTTTGVLEQVATLDRQRFKRKWGKTPW